LGYTAQMATEFKFCPSCGAAIQYSIPEGDNRKRATCNGCGAVHYQNPKLVVGTIPFFKNQILLCKRAIEPRYGYWTLPAGFMENGESTEEGAVRETLEEASARVKLLELFSVVDVPHVEQVHLFFRAQLLDLEFGPGSESLEVKLFTPEEIPWEELAFMTVSSTLQWYLQDSECGQYSLHTKTLRYPAKAQTKAAE
jgi:ADP-ribose pyrophosphatase YjhB (NUDIX family)